MVFNLKKNQNINKIYQTIIDRSRSKFFYIDFGVNDDFESRFDLVIIHSFTIFQYFVNINKSKDKLSQEIFDFMFHDFENNLREMGFGDIAVNKKMKKFISAFYGRILSYSNAYNKYESTGIIDDMALAIKKNIYKDREIDTNILNKFSTYIIASINYFSQNNFEFNVSSSFKFIKMIED